MIQPRIDLQAWLQENAAVPQQALPVDSLHPAELSTDSRQLQPGSVFLPLIGDSFDGHRFLQQAFAQGARLAFCAESYFQAHQAELADLALIRVADTLAAYQSLARSWRRLMGIPVIAVTGSSGKTSTKEILFQVLSPFFRVHRSQANYNNQVGVPKTLLELRPEHALCLVEMGMRGLGQIHELCSVAEPDYGIITNIGPVHLSELGTMENVARAKWELADWLQAHAGLLAINADNSWLHDLGLSYPGRLVRCGRGADDDLQMLESTAAAGSQRIRYRIGE
ncbi:MAG: UDP-N-acetylmuramoyl-tripeptide--D-alanyl-D-alanine ligase, partial [Candidatus Sericytochromatia bacterium]